MARARSPRVFDHPVVMLFVVIAIVAAMGLAAEVLKPLALSVLLAFALTPVARFFERRGLPRVPSVVLTVLGTLSVLLGIGFIVGGQLNQLAGDLADPAKKELMYKKLEILQPRPESNLSRVQDTLKDVVKKMDPKDANQDADKKDSDKKTAAKKVADGAKEPEPQKLAGEKTITGDTIQKVEVVEAPAFRKRLETAIGPFLEGLTLGSFVLVLVLFMMVGRDDLGDRVISVFGGNKVSTTTRTMKEVGERVGRYLAFNALVNASMGLIVGLGVWMIGLPYAVLWGVMTALLRFVPYVGTAIAISLPTIYALASFPGWGHAMGVVTLFVIIEIALNSFIEPILYGKTTGVSALGLLVAAMFWTWLWGVWGLLLSTPLTVSLAVLGKSVPALSIFSKILGEEAELRLDFRYYKKLLALDEDGADEVIEEASKTLSRIEIYDQIVLPALALAEKDSQRDEIDDETYDNILRNTERLVDEWAEEPIHDFGDTSHNTQAHAEPIEIVGVSSGGKPDLLALKMLIQVIDPAICHFHLRQEEETPLALAEALVHLAPKLVVMSHVPPSGLTPTRYLVRRLHSRLEGIPIVVGRWTEGSSSSTAVERLTASGASSVVSTLAEAREKIMEAAPKVAKAPPLSPALA